MTANELDKLVMEHVGRFDVYSLLPHLTLVAEGQLLEVRNEMPYANLYYQWLACLMRVLKPKQVVELGAAAGISTIMMATQMDKDAKLYSVDIDPQAWRWMNKDYPQVIKVLGDDLDMKIWPKDCDLSKTDVWFIDSLHTEDQLRKEFELYKGFWKKGDVVVLDDIRLPGLDKVWEEVSYDKRENTNPCHHTGFGFFIV